MREQDVGAGFRVGHAAGRDWRSVLDDCLEQLGPRADGDNIVFAYCTDHFAEFASEILKRLQIRTRVATVVGATAMGVVATASEYIGEPAMAIMIGALPADSFTPFASASRRERGWFGVVHADPQAPALPELLGDFAEASGAYLVGGVLAPRSRQFAAAVIDSGVSGVLFSEAVTVVTGLTQGCSPIGPPHTITACEANIIQELDDRPAYQVLREVAGAGLMRNLEKLGQTIMVGIPVTGADRPDYLVRNLMGVDAKEGMIAVGSLVEENQALLFCRRDTEAAKQDFERMLTDLRLRVGNRRPRGALYHLCIARGANMFGPGEWEMQRIAETFPDLPLIGCSCNGEIAGGRLYGYTGVLSLFL